MKLYFVMIVDEVFVIMFKFDDDDVRNLFVLCDDNYLEWIV